MKKRILSLALALCCLVTAAPILALPATAAEAAAGQTDISYITGPLIWAEDFKNTAVGALPSGWEKGYPGNGVSFGWANSAGSPSITAEVVQDDTYGKALHFSSTDTDAFLAAPATGTLNYVWEATIVIGGNTNAFGLANNYYAALGKAHGATYISLYPNGNTWSQDAVKYRNGGTSVPFTQDCDPKKGDVIHMKIVSLNGNNYVYYNDTLVATAPSRAANIGIADSVQDDRPGFYTYAGDILVTDVKVSHAYAVAFDVTAGRVAVGDSGDVDLSFDLTFDTTQPAYRQHVTGAYTAAQEDAVRLGIVLYVGDTDVSASLTTATAGAECVTFPASTITEENGYLYATFLRASLPVAMLQKVFSIRPFVQIGDATFYSDGAAYVPAALANGAYISAQDASARARIEEVFGMYPEFRSGAGAKELTFTLFSDFHYKAGLYSTSIADLRSILARADSSNSAFILSGGDITNDMKGSPELYQTYLNYVRSDGSILPAYNIYGNHELESEGNTMALVTPTLTNDANVVWGTADGRPAEDGSIGYYYFESSGFRIVCLDTQYSYNPNHKDGVLIGWEHNLPNSYGCPSAARNATRGFDEGKDAAGNQYPNALGATQLSWLESILMDAARKGTPCIVVAHCGYGSLGWADGNDAAAVREIYQRANAEKAGTVLMSINGHLHTDHQGWRDGVFYLDMNTTRNNWWQGTSVPHYTSDMTYSFEEYDEEGNLLSVTDKPLSSLGMAGNTWFSADPLSCVITISTSGVVVIDGANSDWAYGVAPALPETATGVRCEVTSGTFIACEVYGHAEKTVADDDTHYTVCGSPLCQYTSAHTEHAYTCHTVAEEHLAHAADCTHPATYYYSCSCGKNGGETFTEGDPLGHVFGEWVIVTAPTASTAGERKHTCSRCGADEKETIPAEDPAPAPSGGCAGCASALSTSSAIGAALAVAAAGVALHARKKKGQE